MLNVKKFFVTVLLSCISVGAYTGSIENTQAVVSMWKNACSKNELPFLPHRIFVRIFKSENIVEVWGNSASKQPYKLLKTIPICSASGVLGPKRRQGDLQVPEGFYHINTFNPYSQFHLSMQINYPNASDHILGSGGNLGGDIFIHGQCVSIGCVAITDPRIDELYYICSKMSQNGQTRIPVHIFPCRLSDFKLKILEKMYSAQSKKYQLWKNLQQGYLFFQSQKQVPIFEVNEKGYYEIQ